MAITKGKKDKILEELKGFIEKSSSLIFVNFHGLSSDLTKNLRRSMYDLGAKYFVAKKTLIKKALGDKDFSGEMPELEGEVAIVFSGGEVSASAKSLSDFKKENECIEMLCGVFEKAYISKDVVLELANLPSREVLLGQFVNIINSPRQQMVGVLQAPIRDFISVLRQKSKQ